MKKFGFFLFCTLFMISGIATVNADTVRLYLDTAPNASGSPSWPAFRDAAYADIFSGTFQSQEHGFNSANIDTNNYEVEDYMVYSFGDLGHRLHAFYYIPGETTSSLSNRFQVSIEYMYDGVWYNPYEAYGWGEWVTPSSWINYDGDGNGSIDGVMGSMGNALWGAYGYASNTLDAQIALATDYQNTEKYLGDTRFLARLDGEVFELKAIHSSPVPEPSTWMLLFSGISVLGLLRLRKKK